MSAIFGLLHWDGRPVEPRPLARLGQALAHRGDRAPALWHSAGAGIGCVPFATVPEAVHERLPFVHPASGIVVTADARLDDREALASAVGLGAGQPDGALLAAAFLRWGDQCPEYLRGDFAFAVWDPRWQRLFAARDHFGIKPFYYVADADRFAFATEPGALLGLPGVSREIDRAIVACYLAAIADPSDRTAFQAVRRLGAGGKVTASGSGFQLARYYQPDPEHTVSARSDAELAERFRDLFLQAVRRRLRSSGPVGCMLSGGLDSSAIACAAAHLHGREPSVPPPETWSLVYPDCPACDESAYIQAVVRRSGLPWHPLPVSAQRSPRDVYDLVERLQEPDVPVGIFANGSVCAGAAERGARVILDGHGGDETVSLGYERLQELFDERRMALYSYEYLQAARSRPDAGGWRGLLTSLTSAGPAARFKQRWRRTISGRPSHPPPAPAEASPWPYLDAQLARDAALVERHSQARETRARARSLKRLHHHVITQTDQPRAFEALGRLSGPTPVELRYPLWDKDLVEFCLGLPSRQKFRHGYTRVIMRTALRGILPDTVRRRRGKTDFSPQVEKCLSSLQKSGCKSLMNNHNPPSNGIWDATWIDRTINRFFEGRILSVPDQHALWRCLSVAAWTQTLRTASPPA